MSLLLFFALPIATIILSVVLQKILKCPILVALTFFAIYLVVAFSAFDYYFLVYAILYTIISYITACLTRFLCCLINSNGCIQNLNVSTLRANQICGEQLSSNNLKSDSVCSNTLSAENLSSNSISTNNLVSRNFVNNSCDDSDSNCCSSCRRNNCINRFCMHK